MTDQVAFRRAALVELLDAAEWYEERRKGLGQEFLFDIEESVARASANPGRYPIVCRDVRNTVARRFPSSVIYPAVWKGRT